MTPPTSAQRFDTLAGNYRASEVHRSSPTLARLKELLPRVESVCDVASGTGHTGLMFADTAARIVAVDPAPNMLAQFRELAAERGVTVAAVEAFAEAIPLEAASFDLVVCRLAAHHFNDVEAGMREMTRLAKPGGFVAVIDMEGHENPDIDALNHEIEVLHDPTHVRSYTATRWRELFAANKLELVACERSCRESPAGLTVARWCELAQSGGEAAAAIRAKFSAAPAEWLTALGITRDADGEFRLPVRTLLIVGRKPSEPRS